MKRHLRREVDEALARHARIEKLHRQLRQLLAKWEPRLGVHVQTLKIKNSKSYWATMDDARNEFWFSADLSCMPANFIEV